MMSDKRVPGRIRQALNVESGLNDGIATPFVNVFLAGALSAESISAGGAGKAAIDLVGGAGVGAAIGLVGAALVVLSARAAWSTAGFRPLTVLALGACAYAAALVVHANGFVAAFCAGVAFGSVVHSHDDLLSFTEEVGTLLSVLVWFSFGAVMLVPGLEAAGWRDLVFGILALTLARVVPVAVALAGSGLSRATVLFIGWFGPRGLASVVFGLIAVDALTPTGAHVVLGAVVVTVAMSVVAHGVSASPLAARFSLGDDVAGHAILGHVGSREVRVRTLASSRRRTTGS